jgi:hypothetical protein
MSIATSRARSKDICQLRHPRRDRRVSRRLSAADGRDERSRALRLPHRRQARQDRQALATIRIEDLYALNLQRNINLKDLKIEGFEAWVTFDDQGRSNFRNIHIPPPEPNNAFLFAYSTASVEIKNGVIHYGDARHEISGEGRNLEANVQPDDPNAPVDSG